MADVDISIDTENQNASASWQASTNCAVQFGRLTGGEANDSTITRQGCYISMDNTKPSENSNVFGNGYSELSNGPIFNFYGCYIKNYTSTAANWAFMRGTGPVRMIGSIWDGPIGGAFYHSSSELVDTKFRGNTNLIPAWSIRATFVRPVSNAQFANGLAAFKTFQSYTGIFRDTVFDLDSLGTVVSVLGSVSGGVTCIDSTTFTDSDITDSGSGFVHQAKSINYTVTDTSGTGLTDVKVAVYDTDGDIQTGIQTSSSGAVAEITATFFKWQNDSPSANKAPFDIRLRGYGYQYQDFQSAVSEPIKQEYRLPTNTVTVLSEAAAAALTFITIDFAGKTVTVGRERTLSEIYDYCQSQLALDANMDEPEFLTSQDGVTFTFADDWDVILDASGKIGTATGKTLVFGGTGVLQMLDIRNTIDNLTVSGDLDIDEAVTLTGCTVTGDATINTGGNDTLTFDGVTISGDTTNDGSNTLTINATNSSLTTSEPGTAAGEVDIQNIVNLNVTVQDSSGSAIQDARVYIKDSGGTQLVNALTNSSGVVTTTYNYISDEAISGFVRKGTSSPLFKTGQIAGTITSTGFSTTLILVSDE